jgi:hypothetical protein
MWPPGGGQSSPQQVANRKTQCSVGFSLVTPLSIQVPGGGLLSYRLWAHFLQGSGGCAPSRESQGGHTCLSGSLREDGEGCLLPSASEQSRLRRT